MWYRSLIEIPRIQRINGRVNAGPATRTVDLGVTRRPVSPHQPDEALRKRLRGHGLFRHSDHELVEHCRRELWQQEERFLTHQDLLPQSHQPGRQEPPQTQLPQHHPLGKW